MKLCEEDLRKVVWLSDPALAPDGRRYAYVRAVSDYRTGRNIPSIWTGDADTGHQAPVSELTQRQSMPRFSPDGAFLAFLSDDCGVSRLYVKDLSSGEEKQLTDFDVSAYAWSPDGKRLAVLKTLFHDRLGRPMNVSTREGHDAWRREMDHAPRYTEALMYKLDEAFGFLDGTGTEVCLTDPFTGDTRALYSAKWPCALPSFSSDGQALYWYGRPRGREKALDQVIFRMDLRDGSVRELPAAHLVSAAMPVIEQNGLPVYAGYCSERCRTELFAIDEAAGKEIPLLKDDGSEGVDPALIGDDRNGSMGFPVRQDESGNIFYLTARNGKTFVADTAGRTLIGGGCIQAFTAPVNGRVLYLKSSACRPGELYIKDLSGAGTIRVTDENAWTNGYDTAEPQTVPLEADGRAVRGWALLPAGEDRCPAVLYIHGGPECFYGEDIFFFEAQSLRAAGFAVLWCNPRGSAGYGKEHLHGAYGQEAIDDLTGFLDACIARFPRIDASRVGVTGGSYGGYMTNKLTLQSDRFRAAAAQRTWIDPATSYGTGDMGFLSGSGKTDFRAYMLDRARGSVLRDIDQLNTPTLILHGERDVRCGEEQADQLFNMIRALWPSVPCRLVVFPGENHALTRTGLMHNRIRHMLEIRCWMDKYLMGKEETE